MPQSSPPPSTTQENGAPLLKSKLNFFVIGIGASAGGLVALQRFFENIPAKPGMAFVVVLHLSPNHESNAAAILQRCTGLTVQQVTDTVPIEPDHVYVIAPNKDLVMNDGHLHVTDRGHVHGSRQAIDLLFRTLAEVHEERAVGIILSGTGTDGALGLKALKEFGGVTIVQAPEDAEYDGMPKAAILSGMADFVSPVVDMPQRLLDLWGNARRIQLPVSELTDEAVPAPETPDAALAAEQALQDVMALLRSRTGHDFRHYKRATVLRRIERRLQVVEVPDLPSYAAYLGEHVDEHGELLQDMLISVTHFFRDRDAFEALERAVIPQLFAHRTAADPIRAWVAGCATGEEAYSVSVLLREYQGEKTDMPRVQVFATDIDERALATARAGLYPEAIVTDVSPSRIARFFDEKDGHYRVAKFVRETVLFAAHNVLRDPPFSRLDLICCRNLLIYVNREAQARILEMFRFALKPDGYLMLGTSETADAAEGLFTVVDKKHRIYRVNPHAHAARHVPMSLPRENRPMPPGLDLATSRTKPTLADLHQAAIANTAPPSVLVDGKHNLLHLSEGAGRFFDHASGVPTINLLANVHPALRIPLHAALFQVAQSGQSVQMRPVILEQRDGAELHVEVTVKHVPQDGADALLLVIFEQCDAPSTAAAEPRERGVPFDDVLVQQLEAENHQLKEHLRNTVEHSEVSTEELRASNEELQAINEELRSATEELETSQEELQSTNEELITVNFELKVRVDETAKVNDDLQNLIASSDIGTVFVDQGMRVKRFTPQAARIFNLIPSDVDRSLLDITHRLDYESLAADATLVFRDLHTVERQVEGRDGRHFLARIRPYRSSDDKIEGAVLTFIDVTDLRQAEERVIAGENRLRLAAMTTRDYAILTTDEAGIIATWNEGARRIFGYDEEEILGQDVAVLFTPEDRAALVHVGELRRASEVGRAEDERWHVRKNGSLFFASGVCTPLDEGENRGFVKIARDVTGSKQQESAREALLVRERAASVEARTANELKDQFLAVMSHELKHPLNLIQLNAEMLVRLPEARSLESVRRASEAIRGAVRSQAKIIDDLLDLSRVRTGKLKLQQQPIRVAEVVASIVTAAEVDASENGIALQVHCEEPDLMAQCDPVRTQQIAWNLLNNALKFTPRGGSVAVTLRSDGDFVLLSVKDTGCGIDAQFLPKVFGLFSQDGMSSAPRNGGLGIGLALVHELTVAQGGRVLAESEGLNQGATFTVWIPRYRQLVTSDGGAAPLAEASLDGLRVLAVDDAAEALELFQMILESEGAIVDTATSAAIALEMLDEKPYDLLVSDLGMPDMSGYEFIAVVRSQSAHLGLFAVALSGYGRSVDAERALSQGFDAHLTKPVDLDELKKVVSTLPRPPAALPGGQEEDPGSAGNA